MYHRARGASIFRLSSARPYARWQEMPIRYFEDFAAGDAFELGEVQMTEAEILEFAPRFDPQPFPIDHEAAGPTLHWTTVQSKPRSVT